MNTKVLFADDDPEILEVVKIILEDVGIDVQKIPDPENIIEVATEMAPALILLDIRMSGVDGRDICKQLKFQESTKNIPVVLVSANKDTQKDAMDAGADDFLCKPFDIDDLVNLVKKYVET